MHRVLRIGLVVLVLLPTACSGSGQQGRTEVKIGPSSAVAGAVYVTGGGDLVRLEVGRTGQRQMFLPDSPRPGYFNESTGENWEKVIPLGAILTAPVVAVELRVDPFIKRPITA